jgi:hypothetical protein
MFETLFGAEMPLALRFFIAFIIVLGLIGGTAYVVRRFGAERLGGGTTRGRQPRLAVIDAAAVDGRRRLILIRRDNIEHLLMIGGPSDLVIEPNIVRAVAASREAVPPRPQAAPDMMPRPAPLGEATMWPLQPHAEPAAPPPPPPRVQRPAPIHDEPMPWPAEPEAPAPVQRQSRPLDPLAGLAAELARMPIQPEPSAPTPMPLPRVVREGPRGAPAERPRIVEAQHEPRPEPRAEVRPEPPLAAESIPGSADQNLAEMAQRLEAALRRPSKSRDNAREATRDTRPVAEPMSEPATVAEAPAPEPKPARAEARAPRGDGQKAPPSKSLYDNLEQEMASLLGRPNSKN